MRFEWDEAKRRSNLRDHGIDFAAVERVLAGANITFLDDRFDYGEARLLTFGLLNGEVVAITHTETDEVIRVISFRKASKNEEKTYFKEVNDRRD
jgi:uncharacterized DUF497 family protein